MKFTTPVKIKEAKFSIDHNSKVMLLGSCFVENIGAKLEKASFLSFINPFGVLYNPLSVASSLNILQSNQEFEEKDLFKHGSLWNSFSHSSLYSATSEHETLQIINSRLIAARYFLQDLDVLVITLGTAWIYELKESGEVVANCHKLPAERFNRRRLSVDESVENLDKALSSIKKSNPKLQVLMTVSPIRHWKDGAHENTLSKATLHLTIDELISKHDWISYFPAYEIMIDELRDYRFYASDMLHPSDDAVKYIWKRFSESYFSTETQTIINKVEKIKTQLNHRPIHSDTEEYQLFVKNTHESKMKLIEEYPFLRDRL